MRTICIASTAVCLCLARPYATKAHSHSHTRASRVHHSLPHCSHPALAPHILKPLPTTTLPLRSFFSLQHSRHPQRRPFHPQPPCLHALRPPPPAAILTPCHVVARATASRPSPQPPPQERAPTKTQVPSTQSQQRQPHDDAPQQRHTATAAEQRRPHVRPQAPAVAAPQAAITHTPTCMHTHTHTT